MLIYDLTMYNLLFIGLWGYLPCCFLVGFLARWGQTVVFAAVVVALAAGNTQVDHISP